MFLPPLAQLVDSLRGVARPELPAMGVAITNAVDHALRRGLRDVPHIPAAMHK